MKQSPVITIVTPTYNQAEFIPKTFDSLLDQKIPKNILEYIVVDALSNDGTMEIVKSYDQKFKKKGILFSYIREKDKGQSDAINKGWKLAKGEIVGYLNSDDYYEKGAIKRVIDYFSKHTNCQWAYGGWNLVNRVGKIYATVKHKQFDRNKLLNYCNIGQPSCFFRKKLLIKFGYLNPNLHLAFDYDLWLRFVTKHKAGMIPGILSNMRYYSDAKSAIKTNEQLFEILKLAIQYTREFSFNRLLQYCYFIRGFVISKLHLDINSRIVRTE